MPAIDDLHAAGVGAFGPYPADEFFGTGQYLRFDGVLAMYYDQGMTAFNAAQMMGVPSKLIVFPQENHWILRPQNALFWHRSYFDWLDRWMK